MPAVETMEREGISMSISKKVLIATGPGSTVFPFGCEKTWVDQGLEIFRVTTVKQFSEIYNTNDLNFVYLESTFCQNAFNLIDLSKSNPIEDCVWVYSLRGNFVASMSQLALSKGAHYVLHDPPTVSSLFSRFLKVLNLKEKQAAKNYKPLTERMNEAVDELNKNGKFYFGPEEVADLVYENRHPNWSRLVEEKVPQRGTSFDGYDVYRERYSSLLKNLSREINGLHLVFITLRSRSVLDDSLKNMKVLISSHNDDLFPKGQKVSNELTHYPDLFHAVRTNKSVVLNKPKILADHVQMSGINCIFSVPVKDQMGKPSGMIVALCPNENLEVLKLLEHAIDLTSLITRLGKPLQCLEYFDRVYSSAA